MISYLFLLFIAKTFLFLDFFINIFLTYLLVNGETYYSSDKVNKLTLFLIPGALIHYFTVFAFSLSKFLNRLNYATFLPYTPYFLLSVCTIFIGILLCKGKEYLISAIFMAHGLLSLILLAFIDFWNI